jgi:hypothetical protein
MMRKKISEEDAVKIAELRATYEETRRTAAVEPTAATRAAAKEAWAALDAASPRTATKTSFASRAGKRQDAQGIRAYRQGRSHATKKTPAQLNREIAAALASEDEGVFYLTDTREQPLELEFSSRPAAKRAAMKLVREGVHPRVEIWHRWHGGRYMQGLADEDGWSDV